jgi:hypothetical protein
MYSSASNADLVISLQQFSDSIHMDKEAPIADQIFARYNVNFIGEQDLYFSWHIVCWMCGSASASLVLSTFSLQFFFFELKSFWGHLLATWQQILIKLVLKALN